jgi:type IV secretory pathway VirB10-like protein
MQFNPMQKDLSMKRLTTLLAGFGMAALIAAAGCSQGKKADDIEEQPLAAKAAEGAAVDNAQPGAPEAQAPAEPGAPAAAPAELGAAAAGGMTKEQVAEKTMAMMDQMSAAVSANQGNCDGMADALQKLVDENQGVKEMGKKVIGDDPAAKQWFEQNYKDKLVAVMSTMIQGMQSCESNERLKQVFAHMN